jgi:hypothetical protein
MKPYIGLRIVPPILSPIFPVRAGSELFGAGVEQDAESAGDPPGDDPLPPDARHPEPEDRGEILDEEERIERGNGPH